MGNSTAMTVPESDKGISPFLMHRSLVESPHLVESAKGSYLRLADGRTILDACGGAAVVSVGHSNDRIVDALTDQLKTVHYVHTLDYTTNAAEELATLLLEPFKDVLSKVYVANSGSEANEAALKLAVQYFYEQGQPSKCQFITRKQSYHGNCLGGLSASSHLTRRKPFEGYLSQNFHFVSAANEYRRQPQTATTQEYVEQLANELESKILELGPENVAGFMAETIVGASTGALTAPAGYFKEIRRVCDKYDVLLILDEVMCGSGRTGTFFAWEQEGIVPDIVTCGKAIASGYSPLSLCICTPKMVDGLMEGARAFNNGHTFQAHSLGCRAGIEVLKIMREEKLFDNVKQMGQYLQKQLISRLSDFKTVGNVRGRGLFWGIELVEDRETKKPFDPSLHVGHAIQRIIWEKGVAVYPGAGTADGVAGDHILLAPMFNVTRDEIDLMVDTIVEGISEFEENLN